MNTAGIIYESLSDGIGVRTVVFLSGCTHLCEGCHNSRMQDEAYGIPFTIDMQDFVLDYIAENDLVTGLTLSGGDPLNQPEELLGVLKRSKRIMPWLNIWVYTGFDFEEVRHLPVMPNL